MAKKRVTEPAGQLSEATVINKAFFRECLINQL